MKSLSWIGATFKANWANAYANKSAFWSLLLLMLMQNFMFFSMWGALFSRVSSLNGWGLREVAYIYGGGNVGFGLMFFFLGGLNIVSETISSGQLDVYLTRPRNVLFSMLTQRVRSENIGDFLSGLIIVLFVAPVAWQDVPLMISLAISAGLVFVAARLIAHSLVFWGLPSDTSEHGFMAFLIMATNPQKGFGPWGKAFLLTLFPAGYIGLLPVEIIREFSWKLFALQIGGSLMIFLASIGIFYWGLRRYNSGNMNISFR